MKPTVEQKKDTQSSVYYTLEFLFQKGKTQPSSINNLPRQEVYRFAVAELIFWLQMTEEDAVIVIDDLMEEIDEGAPTAKHIFSSGDSFSISSSAKK